MSKDLIVFGEDWGAHPSSTQHLMRRLVDTRNILWVNSIGMRRPRMTPSDFIRAGKKLGSMFGAHKTNLSGDTPERMHVVSPRAVSWPGNRLAEALNKQLLTRQLRDAVAQNEVKDPILWLSLPSAVDMVGALGERATVYYCGDDFSALAGVDHVPIARMEKRLADRADLILAASPMLAERFPSHKTALLPHGTDVDHFKRPTSRPADMPSGKPIAGFYGSLAEWLDVELIAQVAEKLPHWNFVFIGKEQTDVSRLKRISNIHLLGEKSHSVLPSYVQHWHISMMPFKDNRQIRACNPLKLREYLSTGRPVISTYFPALDGYRDLIRVAGDATGFARLIEAGSADFPHGCGTQMPDVSNWRDIMLLRENVYTRRTRMEDESWDARANQLETLLCKL